MATCRLKAADAGMPSLIQILRRVEMSLSDHAARAITHELSGDRALSAPRTRMSGH